MTQPDTCIYCGAPPKSREHPLPAAFGEFENAASLDDRICPDCNSKRLGLLDEQLTRCGPEAFLRRHYDVQGRAKHEEVNPFYRGSAGGARLELKAFDEKLGLPVLLEKGKDGYRQARQLIFVEREGEVHNLPLREGTTAEQLRETYQRLGVKPPADLHMIYGDGEEWVPKLVAKVWPGRELTDQGLTAVSYNGAVTTVRLTNRYFRAIAKIGFHYFLTQFPQYRGGESMFADIRSFIMDEKSALEDANKFVGHRRHALLGEMLPPGARPDGWRAHVLAAELKNGEALAHVQLFLTEDWPAPIYTVRLGTDQATPPRAAAGHAYVYFDDGLHGQYVGEARPLGTTVVAMRVPPLGPVVKK